MFITIIIDLLILGLCYLTDNCNKISASCRQYFDYKLFKFEEQNLYGKYTESEIMLPSINKLVKLHDYKIRCKEHFDGVHTSIKDRQALIDERRNLGFTVPNALYQKCSPRIHKIIEDSKVNH